MFERPFRHLRERLLVGAKIGEFVIPLRPFTNQTVELPDAPA
jgi:hypothetical protein